MGDQDIINITVVIGGRPYPLKVKAGDESSIRKIVTEINDKINDFQLTYSNKDKQDSLAMAVLTYAVNLHKQKENELSIQDNGLVDKLEKIDGLLSQLL